MTTDDSRAEESPDEQDGEQAEVEEIFRNDDEFDPQTALSGFLHQGENEKYVVKEQIAEGGMGAVFRVFDKDLQRSNVIKVIRPEKAQNRQMFINFITEARITGKLEHPNIIPVHDVGVMEGNRLYFSMKEIVGEGLDEILERSRKGGDDAHSLFALLTLFRKVCDAIAFAHSKDIIHRDIKPDNIMVGNFGEVLVVDWGLARDLHQDESPEAPTRKELTDSLSDTVDFRRHTQYGDVKGSAPYMAPEQAQGLADQIDKRTDIFLLGSTLYDLATLTPPFEGESLAEMVVKAQDSDVQHPQERAPQREIPTELGRIILKAMAYQPDERYQAVEELIEDIDDLLAGQTASEQRTFAAGEFLMVEGEVGTEAYVILDGTVEVFKTVEDGTMIPLMQLSEGDAIGEMAIISDAHRSASVCALTETHVVIITHELITQGLDKLPPWMGNVIAAMVERLRAASANVHPLTNSNCSYHVLSQLMMIYVCWGRPRRQADTGHTVIVVDTDKAVRQIAANLCIAGERVAHIFGVVLRFGLIQADSDGGVFIPNLDLFRQNLESLRERYEVASELGEMADMSLLFNDGKLVVRHTLPDAEGDNEKLEIIEPEIPELLLGGLSPDEVSQRIEGLVDALEENVE